MQRIEDDLVSTKEILITKDKVKLYKCMIKQLLNSVFAKSSRFVSSTLTDTPFQLESEAESLKPSSQRVTQVFPRVCRVQSAEDEAVLLFATYTGHC